MIDGVDETVGSSRLPQRIEDLHRLRLGIRTLGDGLESK